MKGNNIKQFIKDLKREFSGYNPIKFSKDLMAGLTVAAVALPLALAFGVSSGADASAGLITAILAGIVIGLLSGASYQISGPTGAMAAILVSLVAKYQIQGMLMAGLISGVMLILLALLKVGKLVTFIPAPVITGFTSGIAVIIALGQIDNFFGSVSSGENAVEKLISYKDLGFSPNWMAMAFGLLVVLIMVIYPKKLQQIIPSSLAAIIVAVILNFILNPNAAASTVAEVGEIPRKLITDQSLLLGLSGFDFSNITQLISPAFSIAMLGMIESLLCGAAAGKMKGEKLNSTRELIAQGIGNIIIPLMGGVPATAAIARTSVVIKSGGQTRLASVIHSITLILSMFLLGGVMSRIPLAALAGVLMVTAFRMNDFETIKKYFSKKRGQSILLFLLTMSATVIFDLTVAIVIGVAAAMVLFIVRSAKLQIKSRCKEEDPDIRIVSPAGSLFFGTQNRLTEASAEWGEPKALIFALDKVTDIDDSAIEEIKELTENFRAKNICVLFCGANEKVRKALHNNDINNEGNEILFEDLSSAVTAAKAVGQKEEPVIVNA